MTNPIRPQKPSDEYLDAPRYKEGGFNPLGFRSVIHFNGPGEKRSATTAGVAPGVDKMWSPKGRSSRIK
jgi:hypothetical protein